MAKKRGKQHPIRVGVVGVGRGRSFMQAAAATGMELVAICDIWEERLIAEGKALNVPTFVDYDEFLGCDMDAVVLANYFHQHAPFAIKSLNAGKLFHNHAHLTAAEWAVISRMCGTEWDEDPDGYWPPATPKPGTF